VEAAKGSGWIQAIHPEDLARATQDWETAVQKNIPYYSMFRMVRPDGVVRWVSARADKMVSSNGELIGYAGTISDITTRKLAEDALRESERRYKSVIGSLAEGIILMEASGKIIASNSSAQRILGISEETFLSLNIRDGFWNMIREDGSAFASDEYPVTITALTGEPQNAVVMGAKRSDETLVWLLVNTTTVSHDENGKPQTVVASFMDITEARRTDGERRALELQLMQSQKMEALGTLAGGIAHDFNNILAAILGHAELTSQHLDPDAPLHANLREILKASHRARELVQQILAFSQQKPLEKRPTVLSEVLAEALKLLRSTLPASIELRGDLKSNQDVVFAEASQIHRVLLNLGTNAAYAMRERGGVLSMRLLHADPPTGLGASHNAGEVAQYVCAEVSDTGCGMDESVRQRIFEPFYTTKNPGEGTGLGLAVVHGVMENHGGFITVESKSGAGTTFRLFFPMLEQHQILNAETKAPDTTAVPVSNGERILVVDDEEIVGAVTVQLLRVLGYAAMAVQTPFEALELWDETHGAFDAVITDLSMPGMSGLDLVVQLHERGANVPMVLASGYIGGMEVEKKAADLGIREFLAKPFTHLALGMAVRRSLDEYQHGVRQLPLKFEPLAKGVQV